MSAYLALLALTVATEAPLAALVVGRPHRERAAITSVFLNVTSHPLAHLALRNGLLSWGAAELLVSVAEAIGYRTVARLPWPRALLVSGVGNAATVGLSLILRP